MQRSEQLANYSYIAARAVLFAIITDIIPSIVKLQKLQELALWARALPRIINERRAAVTQPRRPYYQ